MTMARTKRILLREAKAGTRDLVFRHAYVLQYDQCETDTQDIVRFRTTQVALQKPHCQYQIPAAQELRLVRCPANWPLRTLLLRTF